jgi:23S rRNA (cytidine2498-2'-O)-methyltransferase
VRAPSAPSGEAPRANAYLWTCRDGFEAHLYEELAWQRANPRLVGRALVQSDATPAVSPAFARIGFLVGKVFDPRLTGVEQALARSLEVVGKDRAMCLQAWTPDTAAGNKLSAEAQALLTKVRAELSGSRIIDDPKAARDAGGVLAQLCYASPELVIAGWVAAREALSLAPGGRQRMRTGPEDMSRAAAKLEEALDGFGIEPGRGETCVDLGAAPGGWTARLLQRGARVIAVDPANLAPSLKGHGKLTHARQSAFDYAPDEPADWVFCDMAWRPLEVAALLGKWARNRWADFLVANLKLPMKDKNPVIHRARHALSAGGWHAVTVRQLYHDRDEVTVTARLR